MSRGMIAAALAMLLAGCNNSDERIEELEGKIEQLESSRAGQAGGPTAPGATPTPGSTASAAALAGPVVPPPASRAGDGAAPDPDGDVCNDGSDRHLTLVNRGEQTMMYFYASPPAAGDWEEDVLGEDVVTEGERYRINFNTDRRCTCTYDTRAVFADDSEVIRKVDVCRDHQQTYP